MKRNMICMMIGLISITQETDAQDVRKVAVRFRNNVVKINAVFANGRDENGFGTVIAERNNKLYIVTAKHVVYDMDYRSRTNAVKITFFTEQAKSYPAVLLNLSQISEDITLLEVDRPKGYVWTKKFYFSNIEKGTEVLFIGRSEQWYIPIVPSIINEIANGEILVDIPGIQRGTSGAPLISSDGLVGLIFADTEGVSRGYSVKKLIDAIVKSWNYPWQMKLNEQTQEVHAGYVIGSLPRLFSNIFNEDEKITDYLGAFSFGYRHEFKKRWGIGGTIVIERFDLSTDTSPNDRMNAFYIMPDGRYYYLSNKRFKLYSGINAGIAVIDEKEDNNSTLSATFAFHVNLIGVRVGRKLGAFCDLGVGYRGTVNLGASFRFSDF